MSFLGSVVRVRVGLDGRLVSLDMFNNTGLRPPAVGEAVEIGFDLCRRPDDSRRTGIAVPAEQP